MIALLAGRVIDGTGRPPLDDAVVIIDGDRIASVSQSDACQIPPEVKILDLSSKTVMPGLINCHTHLLLDGSPNPLNALRGRTVAESVLTAAQHAGSALRAGITTVRDLGGWLGMDLGLKKAIDTGLIPGPQMLVSNLVLCMTGGHGHSMGREVDGPDEARKGAREQLKAGVDVVKLIATGGSMTPGVEPGSAQLTVEEMQAAVEEAQKAGKLTAAHAQGTQGIKNAIRAGVDSIEHGYYLDTEVIDMMLEHRTVLVPTLSSQHQIRRGGLGSGIPAFVMEKAGRLGTAQIDSFKTAHQAGVRIAAGNDGGTPHNRAENLTTELELMVAAGMSPVEALNAAHKTAAELLGLSDQIGTIEPGKIADLVVLNADPLDDISAVRQVHMVIKAGKTVSD